jgi:alkylation response protein AidB-like acyl-CoA dehydrogenase
MHSSSVAPSELKSILAKAKAFVQEELYPLEQHLHVKSWEEMLPLLSAAREKVKASGLWLPQISKEYGGLGLSVAQFGELSEVLGGSPIGHYCFNCQAPDAGNMEILIEFGTDEQKEKYLYPLLKGEIRSCFAMTEPGQAGSNPTMLDTNAVKQGDEYVINGHKWFTSSFDGAAFAIVMLVTDPEAENRYLKASQIIVPTDTEGLEFVRNIPVMGTAGGGWMSHSEIKFKACRVPLGNVLGMENAGFLIAQKRLGPGRIHHCMRWIGICERAFDMMCRRALNRRIAPDKTLADKQTIQNWIAESRAEINAARLMVRDAASKMDEEGDSAAKVEISTIKFFCADVLRKVLERAVQTHGALGITDDTPLAFWYGHERGARIYDGADEVHKSRVAKLILREYRK